MPKPPRRPSKAHNYVAPGYIIMGPMRPSWLFGRTGMGILVTAEGDICRQVSSLLQEYDGSCENKLYLERRLRDFFEDFVKANENLADTSKQTVRLVWRYMCTEVELRRCRDICLERYAAQKAGKQVEPETHQWHMQNLENFEVKWSAWWKPLNVEEFYAEVMTVETEHYLQLCLQSQLVERKDEFAKIAEDAGVARVEYVFAGMPELVKEFVKSSTSSASKQE